MKARVGPSRARKIQAAIAQILHDDWDPIGVKELTQARYEYDSYVGGVYRLLASGASAETVAEHLFRIEAFSMGLPYGDAGERLIVAQKLCALDVSLGEH